MKILYVIGILGDGGVERMTLQWVNNLLSNEVQIDFIVQNVESKKNEEILLKNGCKIYKMPYSYEKLWKRKQLLNLVMSKTKYDIIHVHGLVGAEFPIYKQAKQMGIPVRIAHSHNSNCIFRHWYAYIIHKVTKGLIRKYATTFLGCSKDACNFYYGSTSKATIVPNGIDTNIFRFYREQREEMRKKYGVEEKIIYGSVGRCERQKNQLFLMEIYKEILNLQPSAHFILIGHGSLEQDIEEKAERLKLINHLIWIKDTSEVNRYMSMMDVFVLPSLFEGLVVVGVEAQSMGLPLLVSEESYHEELNLTTLVNKLGLNCTAVEWAKKCIELFCQERECKREESYCLIEKADYSINSSTALLKKIYESELKKWTSESSTI